jgi:hypothetical protein
VAGATSNAAAGRAYRGLWVDLLRRGSVAVQIRPSTVIVICFFISDIKFELNKYIKTTP